MSSNKLFFVDELNVDLNTLVTCKFSYNFEALKLIIAALVKNQRKMDERLNDRDKVINQYDNKFFKKTKTTRKCFRANRIKRESQKA